MSTKKHPKITNKIYHVVIADPALWKRLFHASVWDLPLGIVKKDHFAELLQFNLAYLSYRGLGWQMKSPQRWQGVLVLEYAAAWQDGASVKNIFMFLMKGEGLSEVYDWIPNVFLLHKKEIKFNL